MPLWVNARPEAASADEKLLFKEIAGDQRFTTEDFHQKIEWKVEEKAAIQDTQPLKGQSHSVIDWENQEPKEWLDIDRWLSDRSIKDATPDWKIRIRQNSHKELVGKVLKCSGTCQSYRGVKAIDIRHLSQIREGDEVQTGKDSYLWIFMMDGTLVRLSPESSVSFNEIDFSKSEAFFVVRLNQGHFYWHNRVLENIPMNPAPQTDQVSLPLMVREANIDFFERQIYQKQDELQRFLNVAEGDSKATEMMFERMNDLKKRQKEKLSAINHHVLVVAPNYSLDVINTSFDAVYMPNEKGYFKRREDSVVSEVAKQFKLHYRGYENTTVDDISSLAWIGMDSEGKNSQEEPEASPHLSILELVTKRITSIELAGEIWTEKYSLPILNTLDNETKLATDEGYRLWGNDLNQRFAFLHEYTRRVETTNLKSLNNLVQNLSAKGDWKQLVIDEKFYVKALETYVKSVKTKFNQKSEQRRMMNDLQFYAWILKNDK